MKVLFISTPKAPTLNIGSNGLGRHVYDFISKFIEKDCEVTVISHPGSKFEWKSIKQYHFTDELNKGTLNSILDIIKKEKFDAIIDNTHFKVLSMLDKNDSPILNFIHDEECGYMPANTLLGNERQKLRYPNGKVMTTGIIFKNYPLFTAKQKEDYFCFCGKLEPRKGYDIALKASIETGIKTIFAGPDMHQAGLEFPTWVGEIRDHNIFCDFVGKSKAMYYPSRADAGGMGIWQAAALGTPTLTTTQSGAQCNVIHKETGYIAKDFKELVEYSRLIWNEPMDPERVRAEAKKNWDLDINFEEIFNLVDRLSNGERW